MSSSQIDPQGARGNVIHGPLTRHQNTCRVTKGYITIFTLAALAFISSILLSVVPAAILSKRQTRNDALRLQGEYVLQAVFHQAIDQWRNNPDYTGETVSLEIPVASSLTEKHPESKEAPLHKTAYNAHAKIVVKDQQISIRLLLAPSNVNASEIFDRNEHEEPDQDVKANQQPTSAQPFVFIARAWNIATLDEHGLR